MGRFSSMVAVFLVALVLRTTTPAQAIDCTSVISNVFPCANFLKNPNFALPESSCCKAATKWNAFGDVDNLCKCIQPFASQFLASKAQQLPGLCNLGDAFSPLVKCLVPPSALPSAEDKKKNLLDGPLPPLPFGPLPPLPFGPLPPLPFGPLPPLPFGPLPPFPFVPPSENQQKSEQNGLLPPLPLVPLPPFGPLPPLPFRPLPPLSFAPFPPFFPFVPPAKNQQKSEQNSLLPPLPLVPLPPLGPLPPLPSVPLPNLPPLVPTLPLPVVPLPKIPPFVPLPSLPFVPPTEKHN